MGDSAAAAAYHAEDDFSVAELDAHLFTPHHERIETDSISGTARKKCALTWGVGWVGGWV